MGVRIGKIYVWPVCNRSSNIFLFMKKTIAESNEKTKKFSHLNYCADRDFAV